MKKLLSLILSITMLTSVAQLSAFADINATAETTEDASVSSEASLQDESEDVAEVSQDEPVLYSNLEQESAKLISLTAEETGFKLTDNSDEQANSNSDVQATATAEQTETEPTTDDCCGEEEHNHSLPAGVTTAKNNLLKETVTGTNTTRTNTVPKFTTATEVTNEVKNINTYYNSTEFSNRFNYAHSFVVPGMGMGKTDATKGTNVKGEICPDMVPQAICEAGDYILISAYCAHKIVSTQHKSVIYVLDNTTSKSHEYITTLVLPNTSHVGGIAYDDKNGYVWIADNNTSLNAQLFDGYVSCFKLSDYDDKIKKDKEVNDKATCIDISFSRAAIHTNITPDCMTFHDGYLYICNFLYTDQTDFYQYNTTIGKYKINGDNLVAKGYENDGRIKPDMTIKFEAPPQKASRDTKLNYITRVQGISIVSGAFGDRLLITSSYSRNISGKNYISKLYNFELPTSDTTLTLANSKKNIDLPPMAEGMFYDGNYLYVLYESSASKYYYGADGKAECDFRLDRVTALDIQNFFYDVIVDMGQYGKDGSISNPNRYEQVVIDSNTKYTSDNGATVHPGGETTPGGNDNNLNCYRYYGKVESGQNYLVRFKGNFDLAAYVPGYKDTRVNGGFRVMKGGTLTVANATDGDVCCRRSTFANTSEKNAGYEPYTGPVISVQKGGKLSIQQNKNKKIIFQGGVSSGNSIGVVPAINSMICTENSGTGTSEWDINGVELKQIAPDKRNEAANKYVYATGIIAYGNFNKFNLNNCSFRSVYATQGGETTSKTREGAALLFTGSFKIMNNGTFNVTNCTFDNSALMCTDNNNNTVDGSLLFNGSNLSDANKTALNWTASDYTEFGAIRFQGSTGSNVNLNFDNIAISNYKARYGAIGFVRRNMTDKNANEDTNDNINRLTMNNIKITNYSSVKNSDFDDLSKYRKNVSYDYLDENNNPVANPSGGNYKQPYYYGPLTFGKNISNIQVTNSTFSDNDSYESGGIVFANGCDVNNATIGTNVNFTNCVGYKNAGALGVYGNATNLTIDGVTINQCKSTNGSAIMIYGSSVGSDTNPYDKVKCNVENMILQNSTISECGYNKDTGEAVRYTNATTDYSGTVRSTGGAACKLTVDNCNITGNKVWKDGGGIYWNAMGTTTNKTKSSLYIKDSVISNNTAAESGGGIYCEADITGPNDSSTKTDPGIVRTVISGNKAGKDGGGICQTVYDNSKETSVSLTKTKLALGEKVEINNNLAKGDGGGVAFILRDSANIKDVNAASNYSLTFEISDKGENSAVISNNQAEFYGGGIYYGTGSEITTNDGALDDTAQAKINNYTKSINLYAGKINNNKANSHGGGIYSNSGAIIFKKGEIDNNEAGAKIVKNEVTLKETGNGGGGAVFVINGGSVTVYNGFIRNNKAFKSSTTDAINTTYEGATYNGVGGGICVANGAGATDDKRSKFTLTKEDTDNVYNVGIYSNEADFAADDVYASGKYTKLEVPKVRVMNLTDYKGKATGWFEDYNNGDTNYAQYGTNLATEGVGSRYRRNIQQYASKYKIPDTATNARTVNGDMITDFVNVNDKYVCMTLGAIASTSITNNIKVPDLDNLGTYKSVSGTPHDVALKYTITRNDGDNFTANDLVFDIDGKRIVPDIPTPGNTFSFYLKDGETINFPNMSDNIKISVKVEYVKSTNGETISATGENISYVKKTDNKVVTNGIDGTTSASTTSESITTDGNKIQTFTFDNVLVAVRVNINFFDRNLVNGEPADIKSKETTYCKDFIASACEPFFSGDTSDSPVQKMITATGVEVGDKYKNVVDDYHLWTSQTEAEEKIKNFATSNTEYMNLVSKKYSSADDYKFHSNNYGIPTTENWLTYTTVEGNVKSYEQAKALEADAANIVNASKEIGQVNVWMFNTPKKYTVNVYEATVNDPFTKLTEGEKYIFDAGTPKSFAAYYNQRIGTATGDTTQDENTNHLNNYDLSGIIKDSNDNPVELNTAKEIKVGNDTYKFSYWSFDENGKTVASTNYGYNYRITTDTDLYPVYEKTPMRLNRDNVGVTTTANQIDVFFDNQGVAKTRLNTVINPYNCDDNDSRISHVSAIYIIASKNATVDKSVIDGLKKIIHKYYTDNSVTSSGSMDISTLINNNSTLKIKDENGKEVTIKKGMYYVYTAEKANLTNKNRTEFTLTFDTSALLNRRLLAFTAMKFKNDWKVSDNCYDYSFDENGAMNEVKNITSVY